jgi:hypothetical protein
VGTQGFGKFAEHRNFGDLGLDEPMVQKNFGLRFISLLPKQPELFFEGIGDRY